jgi:ATP-dependent Lhr-like helicase
LPRCPSGTWFFFWPGTRGWYAPARNSPLLRVSWKNSSVMRPRPQHGRSTYSPRALSPITRLGCGRERLTFCFPEDASLFGQARTGAAALLPSVMGRYSLSEIADHGGLDGLRAAEQVWKQTWQGALTNDTFEVVRRGVLNSFTPQRPQDGRGPGSTTGYRGHSRWRSTRALPGSWYAVAYEEPEEPDPVMGLELQRRQVRQVLSRYGIVFKELLLRESKRLRWPALFRTLRLMELAGEVYSGYFFEHIPGIQFAAAEALRMLRQEFPHDAVYWLNAADPASPCGLGLAALTGTLPRRVPTTYIVYHGVRQVLTVLRSGRALEIHVPPDQILLPDYYGVLNELVTREFNPLPAVKVETVNGKPAVRSAYKESLLEFGLREDYRTLVLRKRYG